jgi:hypothetical protein
MSEPMYSWRAFWDREANELCKAMPYALVGGSAISTMTFQAVGKGRLIYLSRDEAGRNKAIPMEAEVSASRIYADPNALPLVERFSTKQAPLRARDCEDNVKLYQEETHRYGYTFHDPNTNLFFPMVKYSLQAAYPSPIHHESREWWVRIPRLGMCYTVEHQLGHGEGSSVRRQHGTSDLILLISAIHAGNRILSKRLALLFSNTYRWSKYRRTDKKHGQQIAENIALALCIHDPRVRSEVDDDQKLYFILKLVVSHHIFFPHSPEALTAFHLLGRKPNEEVLVPHGWEPVERWESGSTDIQDCLARLVKDLSLLVRAFIRWTHPEAIDRVQDKDLEEEIRSLTIRALGILCGNFVWIEDGEWYAIQPPTTLRETGNFSLPAVERSVAQPIIKQGRKGRRDFYRYMLQLSPLEMKTSGGHYTTRKVADVEYSETISRRDGPLMHWLSRYLRARIEYSPEKPEEVVPNVKKEIPIDEAKQDPAQTIATRTK